MPEAQHSFMAKRRYGFDEEKHARFLKEGRGQGSGADYLPWLPLKTLAVELRWCEKRARRLQDVVGTAQLFDLPFKFLDALATGCAGCGALTL